MILATHQEEEQLRRGAEQVDVGAPPVPAVTEPKPGAVTVTVAGVRRSASLRLCAHPGPQRRGEVLGELAGLPARLRTAYVLVVDEVLDPVDRLVA